MTAGLRRLHFLSFAAIATVMIVGLPPILLQRTETSIPRVDELPAPSLKKGRSLVWTPSVRLPFDLRLFRLESGYSLSVRTDGVLEPEVLVYWTRREAAGDWLPASAKLMGSWLPPPGAHLEFPPEAAGEAGRLWLWSLGRRSVLARIELPALGTIPVKEVP